MNNLIITN